MKGGPRTHRGLYEKGNEVTAEPCRGVQHDDVQFPGSSKLRKIAVLIAETLKMKRERWQEMLACCGVERLRFVT